MQRIGLLAGLTLALLLPTRSARGGDWEQLADEEGIKVWQKDVEGSALVAFKGQGKIHASIKKILAVLHDQDRKTEWLARCRENRLVRAKKIGFNVIYNRIRSDFPLVADRDIVAATSLSYSPEKGTVRIDVKATQDPLAPEVDGVVRMPALELSWSLTVLDAENTEATYEVHADPGGSLPAWIVNFVSKEIPFKTLSGLRRQVQKDGYDRDLAMVESALDWADAEKRFADAHRTTGSTAEPAGADRSPAAAVE